jgi:ferrous-iron efflux pump FieF
MDGRRALSVSEAVAAAGAEPATGAADRLKRIAAIAAVAVAGTLIVGKGAAWFATGSVSVLSALIDSLVDLAASAINLLAIRQAIQPADREHRFGHGKAEALAGLAQAAFISGSAAFLMIQAGERLVHPVAVSNSEIGIAVMVLSMVLTLGLVVFQRFVVRRTRSVAIGADSLHYTADLLTNSGVIVSLLLAAELGWKAADPLFALGIGAVILHGVWQILRQSLDQLMDRELPEEDRARIREIVKAHPGVVDMHDLRTRSSGSYTFIQLHLELKADLSLRQAHEIADAVMADILRAYPQAEVLIHEDPYGVPEPRATFE